MTVDLKTALAKLEVNQLPEGWEWTRSSTMAKVARYNGSEELYFKEFLPRNRMENIKAMVRGSRSERWVKQANIARKEGFEVPEVVASGTFANKNGYLVTASGPKKEVPDFLLRNDPTIDETQRQKWIASFARYIGKMHKAGIVHGDLRPGNILMEPTEEGRFVMIDIERNSYHKKIPMKLVKKNLVQLAKKLSFREFTAKDRITFFNTYNEAYGRFNRQEQKALAYDVINLVKEQDYWGGVGNVSSVADKRH